MGTKTNAAAVKDKYAVCWLEAGFDLCLTGVPPFHTLAQHLLAPMLLPHPQMLSSTFRKVCILQLLYGDG